MVFDVCCLVCCGWGENLSSKKRGTQFSDFPLDIRDPDVAFESRVVVIQLARLIHLLFKTLPARYIQIQNLKIL